MVFHGEQADDADGEEGGNHCNIEAQAQIAECPVNQTAQHTSHRIDFLAEDNRFLVEKHIADDSSKGARDTSHNDSYPEWETTIEGLLDSGDIDCVLATFTITDERKQSWDFSTPYFTDYVTVLVEDKSGITSLADLVDKKVGVSSGSTSAKALTKAMIEAGLIDGSGFDADTFDPALWTTGVSFQQYDDYPAISTALSAGEVDAFCVDKSILAIYKTEGRSYIDDKFSPQEYGVATTKGSGLSAYVDELIQGWLADGTIDSLITENGLE